MADTRIYVVAGPGDEVHLVESSHPSLAIKAVVGNLYTAKVVTTKDALALVEAGTKLITPNKKGDE
jgi:hypothetical protein